MTKISETESPDGYTITAISQELACAVETVKKRLRSAGLKLGGMRTKYTLGQVVSAWTGDEKAARTAKVAAESRILEIREREMNGELMPVDTVKERVVSMVAPLRGRMLSLPDALAARCNPSDPIHARMALEEWVRDTLTDYCESYDGLNGSKSKPKAGIRGRPKKLCRAVDS